MSTIEGEDKKNRRLYEKPRILHRGEVEVLAAVCDSAWMPTVDCRVLGVPVCIKTRFG